MAKRKSMISIDFSNFSDYAERLDNLEADLKKVFGNAMEQAAQTVQNDTIAAMASSNLPAGGKYSGEDKDTEASIIRDAKTVWRGSLGEIGLGFDKTKPGAGGFLITGTPKMRPNQALANIYSRKTYEKKLKKQIENDLQKAIDKAMGG